MRKDTLMPRILFCTPNRLTKTLGAPKVIMELAECLQDLGWSCEMRGRFDLGPDPQPAVLSEADYARSLSQFLQRHAAEYDVVDYDHNYLPYPRTQFAPQTLFVARSVLMAHHFDVIPIPGGRSWKSRARRSICGGRDRSASRKRTQRAHQTIQEADLVNVCNEDDRAELMRCGIAGDKIVVIPFGISQNRRPLFDAVSAAAPRDPVVVFVGTFDYRKGAREFPEIVQRITEAVPQVKFRLAGTSGMFQSEAQVLAHFPAALRQKIEVIPKFGPEELPALLASCSVGIFPSYIEGFCFGVLEMLAASVPVVAYDSPGPPMMLPSDYLVPRGDAHAMSAKVISLLTDTNKLRAARVWAGQRSQAFRWDLAALKTSDIYRNKLRLKQPL